MSEMIVINEGSGFTADGGGFAPGSAVAAQVMTDALVEPRRQHGGRPFRVWVDEDRRFRRLLGETQWHHLPAAVRARFSKPVPPNGLRLYRGQVVETQLSWFGAMLARLARIVGGPLPDQDGAVGPASVLVTESDALGGQIWTRTYTRPGRFPQTINSVKRFSGPTGLEEHLGHGLVMRLALTVEADCLVFQSAGYDLVVAGRRLRLPSWLTPGVCTITHRDLGEGRFAFVLKLAHPLLGQLIHQTAVFEEVAS
ncbi:MAG: DUF4166 domain-containing protein [Hyphomicrobiaceae bacterium]